GLTLEPIGSAPQRDHGVDHEVGFGVELDLDPEVDPALERANGVVDFERALPVALLDRGNVHEVVVSLIRRIAQPREYLEQGVAAHIHNGVAARLERAADRAAEGRSEGVDGRIHAERNWWTEL